MKRYLNRTEKDQLSVLSVFTSFMGDLTEEWQKLGRPKNLIKYGKMSRTWADKCLKIIIESLDTTETAKFLLETSKMEVVTRYKKDAIREYEEMKRMDSVTPVETEDFIEIADQSLNWCMKCKMQGVEADNCNIKGLFIKYGIEPLNLDAPEGKCPYQG